jgi:hypothetical protein
LAPLLQHYFQAEYFFLYLTERKTQMRFIFSKAGLAILLVLLTVVWLGNRLLNPINKVQSIGKQNGETLSPQSQINLQDTTPAMVRWIVETSQPIAAELRGSINSWWERQKVVIADQLVQWLNQQQQYLSTGIQSKLLEMINKALGVTSANPQ